MKNLLKKLFFILVAFFYTNATTPSTTPTFSTAFYDDPNPVFKMLTTRDYVGYVYPDDIVYAYLKTRPSLLQDYCKRSPNQTFAAVCINTKRYELLLRVLNGPFGDHVNLTSFSRARFTANDHTTQDFPESTALFSLCAQYDPNYSTIRADIIKAMVRRNPRLATIQNNAGIFPAEKCISSKQLLSLQALALSPEYLEECYKLRLWRNDPYQTSQVFPRGQEPTFDSDNEEMP